MTRFRRFLVILAALLLAVAALPMMAQAGTGPQPHVVKPLKVGVSPAVRDLPKATFEEQEGAREVNPHNAEVPERILNAADVSGVVDPALQNFHAPNAMPAPIMNFEGVNNVNSVYPPDTNGDVGVDYYVQWVNLSFDIYNKATGVSAIGGPVNGNSLWAGFGGSCQTYNSGDPVVLYDHLAGRWFMSQFTGNNHQCIAVSQTGDPTGAWYLYDYLADANLGYFPDYPKFGVWPDGYYYSANMFGSGYAMAGVFERDQMLAGNPAQFIWFYIPDSAALPSWSQLPADLDGTTTPPAGAPNPFLELVDDAWGYDPPYDADGVILTPFHVDWDTPGNSTFGPPVMIDMSTYPFDSSVCSAFRGQCIPQPDTAVMLESLQERLMYRLQYRNFGDYETLVGSHTVDADATQHAGVRWFELRDSGGGWGIEQAGTYAPDSDHRWMADAAMDASGDIAVGFSVSSSATYPTIRWAGRLAGDPAGTLAQGEDTVIAGSGSQTGSAARWGDYSAMSVDPTDDCTFWYTTEYIVTTGGAPWQTRIASFKFPSCSTGPSGIVQGTVTDAATLLPIANATVDFGVFSTVTAPDGYYSIEVPAGTYDITVVKFGYLSQTAPGVVVNEDDVITQDFELDPAPTSILDGAVVDEGHGWPLYAHIEVNLAGNPVAATYTNPFDGLYSVELPHSATYDLVVTAVFPGYGVGNRSIVLAPGGQSEDFVLTPTAPACTAPGYSAGTPCVPVAGSMVEGFVNDANTGEAIDGATVANDMGGSTATESTPDDPAIGNGYYYLFTPLGAGAPLANTITASARDYADNQATVDLVPDTVSQLDFALDAGWLEVTPHDMASRLFSGMTEDQAMDILNWGSVEANISINIIPIAPTWPHMSPVRNTENLPGSTDPTSIGRAPRTAGGAPTAAPNLHRPLAGPPAFGTNMYPGTDLVSWADLEVPGTWTTVAGGMGSFFAGDFLLGDFSKEYVLDYATNTLNTVDTATGAITTIGPSTPNAGESWTGMSCALDGTMYASSAACGVNSTLYNVDPATGATTVIGAITNATCIIDIAINAAGQLYGVDIVSDNLVQIDPSTGAGTIIGSVGVNANYAQGMDFDEISGTLYWASYTASGELRVIDTMTGASTLVGAFPGGAEVCALASTSFAGGGSLPWLVITPDQGVVPPDTGEPGDMPVNAEFIADGADHYGLFRANVWLTHDTPYDVNDMPVCFIKAFNDMPPGAFADARVHSVAGARITTGCGAGDFCPAENMSRGIMARWLMLSMYGADYSPPPCRGIFADVSCEYTANADYIEALYDEGVTAGCATDPLRYCPDQPVLRSQMAVFLLKASEGSDYTPPACVGIFDDVTCPGGFAVNWIEDLYNHGITAGCTPTSFCPNNPTRRDQMAVFVGKTFELPMCLP